MKVGNEIYAKNGLWNFGGDIPKKFVEHAKISIPFYEEGHDLISSYSDYFVKENSNCYELGCSTGELITKLAHRNHLKKNVNWIGIDSEPNMVNYAKEYTRDFDNIKIICDDCTKLDFKKSDMFISYYCIQFIFPKYRQQLINQIYNSLNWGGAFFIFEKVRASDARFQDIASGWYNEWKENNGFSAEEILNKAKTLKGILEPFSTQGNIDLMKRAGFEDIISIMKYSCFEGFLAIK